MTSSEISGKRCKLAADQLIGCFLHPDKKKKKEKNTVDFKAGRLPWSGQQFQAFGLQGEGLKFNEADLWPVMTSERRRNRMF